MDKWDRVALVAVYVVFWSALVGYALLLKRAGGL